MDALLQQIDILPPDLNKGIKVFVYTLIVLHLAALATWVTLVAPSLCKRKPALDEELIRLMAKNKRE